MLDIDETISIPSGYKLAGGSRVTTDSGSGASFEGSLDAKGNKIFLKQVMKLNKRVYDASDWPSFRTAVTDSEAFNSYITIKK